MYKKQLEKDLKQNRSIRYCIPFQGLLIVMVLLGFQFQPTKPHLLTHLLVIGSLLFLLLIEVFLVIGWRNRVQWELELLQSEERYKDLFEQAPDSIVVMNSKGVIEMVNSQVTKNFSYQAEELTGKNIETLIPKLGDEKHNLIALRKDGSSFPVDLTFGPTIVETGGSGVSVIIRDISEQIQSEKQTKEATKAREDIVAIVSHDLKNPLTAIQISAQTLNYMMKEAGDGISVEISKRLFKAVSNIEFASKSAIDLISNLLDLSKIDMGKFEVTSVNESPRRLMNDAIEMMRPLAAAKSMTIQTEMTDHLPMVKADQERVLQVFSNLIGNSIKFSPPGGKIQLNAFQLNHSEICFEVADQGQGVQESELSKIFDRYWQPERSRKSGTGLGLAIAKGIVEAHGGRIWMMSNAGQGSQIFFTLPTAKNEDQAGLTIDPKVMSAEKIRVKIKNT